MSTMENGAVFTTSPNVPVPILTPTVLLAIPKGTRTATYSGQFLLKHSTSNPAGQSPPQSNISIIPCVSTQAFFISYLIKTAKDLDPLKCLPPMALKILTHWNSDPWEFGHHDNFDDWNFDRSKIYDPANLQVPFISRKIRAHLVWPWKFIFLTFWPVNLTLWKC